MKKLSFLIALCAISLSVFAAPKVALISEYPSVDAIVDDDEKAAADWLVNTFGGELLPAQSIYTANDLADFDVVWIMIDRVGLEHGVAKLPETVTTIIKHVKTYLEKGGSVYLSNHATQYVAELGLLPEAQLPGIFGSGEGGPGSDIWTAQPVVGNVEGQIYDHASHEIYTGLAYENYNEWEHKTYALIGPGHREDHNCMWDLNTFGLTTTETEPNIVAAFEKQNSCKVIATWGHVVDYCCAGIIEFPAEGSRGAVIANGLAAYEWNQNDKVNDYQANIEKLTSNVLTYLSPVSSDLSLIDEFALRLAVSNDMLTIVNAPANMQATIYNLSGQEVASFTGASTSINNLMTGMYMVRLNVNGRTASFKFVK